jgi:methanogenic corrinoid protein MtbC1
MWLRDDCGFTDVTLGVGKLQRLLREMAVRHTGERHDPNAPAILLAPYPGEQHVFGVAMIEEMFREAGWRVKALQACPTHDVASALTDSAYDVIGLSLSRDELVPGVPRTLQSLRLASRNPDVRILVGGPTFSHDPDLWRKVGADEMAVDGREAVIRAHSLLANLHAGC